MVERYGKSDSIYSSLVSDKEVGFFAMFGGFGMKQGNFDRLHTIGTFWSSSEHDINSSWGYTSIKSSEKFSRSNFSKVGWRSCRCIEN